MKEPDGIEQARQQIESVLAEVGKRVVGQR